jgi:hypothetical protein
MWGFEQRPHKPAAKKVAEEATKTVVRSPYSAEDFIGLTGS